jgi:hypothetical protein
MLVVLQLQQFITLQSDKAQSIHFAAQLVKDLQVVYKRAGTLLLDTVPLASCKTLNLAVLWQVASCPHDTI